jgi:peptidoglycan/LPS O-acetylase OafA/YrhL
MSKTQSGTAQGAYRPDIDGLRAIAILSVVLYHAGVPFASGGFTGVDIFFVISGYLIGGHIFSELLSGTFSFLRFYQRRAKRILPAFYAVLIFTLLASLLLLSPSENHLYALSAFSATLSASNIFFLRYLEGYFRVRSFFHPLLMTWSLGVEEQFYAVIPLLMMLLARIRRSLLFPAILTVCVLSFLMAWRQVGIDPTSAFYLLPSRAWELGIGVFLAVMQQTRKPLPISLPITQLLSMMGLALMFAPIFLLNENSSFPGPAAVPSVLGAALLIAVPSSWINHRMLSLPPLVFIGRVSYSWYLWHWPLLSYLHIASNDKVPSRAAFLAIVLSLAAAILSYYLIEQPFRRSTRRPGPMLIRYTAVSLFLLAVCGSIYISYKIPGMPKRFPLLAKVEHEAASSSGYPCTPTQDKLNLSPPCYDASDPRPAVAVWGDSHSNALAPSIRSIANAQNYGFVQLSLPACLPTTGATSYGVPYQESGRRCMQFNRMALHLLQTDRHIRIVFLVGKWTNFFNPDGGEAWLLSDSSIKPEKLSLDAATPLFKKSLSASIQGLQAAGKQVVVLEDVPTFDFDPMSRYASSQIPMRRLLAEWMGSPDASDPGTGQANDLTLVTNTNVQLRTTINGLHDVPLIDLYSALCPNGIDCLYRIGDRLLYRDPHHVTRYGGDYALREFRLPALAPAVTATQ